MQKFVIEQFVQFKPSWAIKAIPSVTTNLWSFGRAFFTVSGWVTRLKGNSFLQRWSLSLFTIYLLKMIPDLLNLVQPCSCDHFGKRWGVNGPVLIVYDWTSIIIWWRTFCTNLSKWLPLPVPVKLKNSLLGILNLSKGTPPSSLEQFLSKIFITFVF